jgi:hypothetical protein
MLLRCTSVGCAVSTGETRAAAHQRRIAARPTPSRAERRERRGERAARRRLAGERVVAPAAMLVHVLGDVREVREVGERAHDVEHVADRQAVEQRGEVRPGRVRFRADAAAKADRRLPDRLDALEPGRAGLLAQHVAEQPPEEARVVPQRVGRAPRRRRSRQGGECRASSVPFYDPRSTIYNRSLNVPLPPR